MAFSQKGTLQTHKEIHSATQHHKK
jgi:hypothetical protein